MAPKRTNDGPAQQGGKLTVFFDYTCQHSYRLKELLRRISPQAHLDVSWKTLSLKEFGRHDDEPSFFDDAELSSFSILVLALAHAVPDIGFDRFHNAMFDAIHAEERELDREDLLEIAEDAGLDRKAFEASRKRWLKAVVKHHREGVERYNAHGTPTVVFGDSIAVYLRFAHPPATDDEARELWESVTAVARGHPGLLEFKRSV